MSKCQNLRINSSQRFLEYEDGTPFFWLGDTAWELFHKLTKEDAEIYLKSRAENGFNVVQAVVLSEFKGLSAPNAYGRLPLKMNEQGSYDPTLPDTSGDYSYWDHIDYIVDKAAQYGIYIAMLPTWGDKFNKLWGAGPEIFNRENAYYYGRWLGNRYKDRINIIWVLGGDRPLQSRIHFEVVNEMARGLNEADGGKHLMTFHPSGSTSSSLHLHNEAWLDFNMIQSGHSIPNNDNYNLLKADYEKMPVKPVLDAEPRYEDLPIGIKTTANGYFDEYDIRQAAYWAVFSGAFGHTYGHHGIWSMTTERTEYFVVTWKEALNSLGGLQMKHLRALMESRPFSDRVPDQELLTVNFTGANHQVGLRGSDHALLYSPCGLMLSVNMGKIHGNKVKASWFNPRNGEYSYIGEFDNNGVQSFLPLSGGRNHDWVLVLDTIY